MASPTTPEPSFPVPQKRTVPSVARSVAAVTDESALAVIIRLTEEDGSKGTFNQVMSLVLDLVDTSMKTRDWSALEKLSSGKFEYLDSQMAPVAAKKASTMPLSETERFRTTGAVPNWVAALAKILMSTKGACTRYSFEGANPVDEEFMQKIRTVEPSVSLKRAVSLKLMLEAEALLEKEVTWFMPEVTDTPAFFLLLNTYDTLHAHGLKPSFSHQGTDASATYLNLVQTLLQRFSGQSDEDLGKYLSSFRFRGSEHDYFSELMSRIDYEGCMERMTERGNVRQKVADALMNRISAKTAVTENPEK